MTLTIETGRTSVRPMKAATPSRDDLLERLRARPDDWISGQSLSEALRCSRTAIWKQVQALRRLGYAIEARPRMGYRLDRSPNAPLPGEVRPLLTTAGSLGVEIAWLPATDSTNRWLAEKADAGAPEGFVAVADTQTAGRGRLDRAWHSPPGLNLYASILLRPDVSLDRIASLSLLLGLAVRRAAKGLVPEIEPLIKWPNDIWLGSRKLGGILCEMRAEPDRVRHVIAGIGLNVNALEKDFPKDIRSTAVSLRLAAGRSFPRAAVLAAILNALEPVYRAWLVHGLNPFLDELNAADLLKGRAVVLSQGGALLSGKAAGIAPDGALLLAGRDGTAPVYAGDVTLRSIADLRE